MTRRSNGSRLECGCKLPDAYSIVLCDMHRAEHNGVSARWRAEHVARLLASAEADAITAPDEGAGHVG